MSMPDYPPNSEEARDRIRLTRISVKRHRPPPQQSRGFNNFDSPKRQLFHVRVAVILQLWSRSTCWGAAGTRTRFVSYIDLTALDIVETDLLDRPYFSPQAQALVPDAVQLPRRPVDRIVQQIAGQLPGNVIATHVFARAFIHIDGKQYHQDSAHYTWRVVFKLSSEQQDSTVPFLNRNTSETDTAA